MKSISIIILLFTPFLLTAQLNQFNESGQREGLWRKQYPNGKMMYEGHFENGKPVGEWKRYHEGGLPKAVINYSAVSDSAFTKLFNEQGKKIAEGNYVGQEKEGKWKYFSGERIVGEEYFVDGLKHGTSRKFYDTGELLETTEWELNKKKGDYQVFYKSGKPFIQCKYSNDLRNGLCLTYFQNGRIEMEAFYKNSLRDSVWNFYDEEGTFKYSLKYDNGKILNPEVRDSIDNLQIINLEKGRENIIDPERYLNNPSEYMLKMNAYK
jgi:antitoxin component YwqK of YwqJK toxin-antitoxin module